MVDPVVDPIVEPVVEPTPAPTPTLDIPEDKVKEIQQKAFGHVLNMIDQKLAEAGYVKPAGVKTTDYIMDVVSAKNATPPSTEPDVDSVAKIKGLQEALRSKEAELESVKTSVSVAKRDFYVDSMINSFDITAPQHLSDTEKSRYVERSRKLIKTELLGNYDLKEVDGAFRVYQKDGSPVLDGTIDMNPIKLDSLVKRDFSEFFVKVAPTPTPVKGTGGDMPKETVTNASFPSSIKSVQELHQHLSSKGLILGQPEYNNAIKEAKEKHPSWFK
jgi:hypothetical protein